MAASGPIPFARARPADSLRDALMRTRIDKAGAGSDGTVPRWGYVSAPGGARFAGIGTPGMERALGAPGQSVHVALAVNRGILGPEVYRSAATRFASFPPQALPGGLVAKAPPVVPFRDQSADVRAVRRRAGG